MSEDPKGRGQEREAWRYPKPPVLERVPAQGHVVIEASAGTGKTHTLEHLVVDLVLSERAQIDELLIVTYTEPATAELKARVRSKLEGLVRIAEHQCDEDVPHWAIGAHERQLLQQQLDRFGRSHIHTIHGFCHRLLVENAFHLKRLFDEEHSDSAAIFDHAFKQALRAHFACDPRLRTFLLAWLKDEKLGSLGRALAGLVTEDAALEPQFFEARLRVELGHLVALDANALSQTARAFAATLARHVPKQWERDRIMELVGALTRALPQFADDDDIAQLLAATNRRLVRLLEGTRYNHNLFRAVYDAQPPTGTTQYTLWSVLVRLIPLRAAVLQALLPAMRTTYAEVKATGLFDYDDMLTGVWEQLEHPESENAQVLTNYLRARYKVALIDEFQDTDPVQWNIFRRVFFESGGANRLFVIGDPKQAIYGFRGADVHTYLSARKAILEDGGQPAPVHLQENFRSTNDLVDAFNVVLEQAVAQPFFDGPIRYDAPLLCGRPTMRALDGEAAVVPVQIVRCVPARGGRFDAYALKRTLGKWIAQETAKLLQRQLRIVDEADGTDRVVGPQDVYILVRNRAEARRMGDYLREVGVPFAFYKEEGLFQTAEARHVLELLVAIAEPASQSNRLKAWATPFFDVPFEQLHHCVDLPETHPLLRTLLDWNVWAMRGEFERLFADVLDRSGVVRREIFAGPSERVLTNITHIFEILLEEVHRERANIADLIVRLRHFVDQSNYPQSAERNIQRLETDESAVQVMTIHKSKGLQADVVFVYGGMSAAPAADRARVCHRGEERVVYLGLPQSNAAMQLVAREAREEDQRLLYVAMTRARARVYLPFIAMEGGELQYTKLDGTYKVVNERLQTIVAGGVDPRLFEVVQAKAEQFEGEHGELRMPPAAAFETWAPPPANPDASEWVEAMRSPPLIVTSYSRMKRTSEYLDGTGNKEVFMREVSARAEAFRRENELPGGTATGIFLHDILERVDFADAADTTFDAWRALVAPLIAESMTTHDIPGRFELMCQQMVWATLTTAFTLPDGTRLRGLHECDRDLREVEFLFPIPEAHNPRIDAVPETQFDIRRGYVKGFIDLMFEHHGKVYFADWKSDSLDHYGEDEVAAHVKAHYEMQAWLYSIATCRMFGIHDEATFAARFGGYVYAFIRGMDEQAATGFFVHRPSFEQVRAFERNLETQEFR